MSVLRAIENKIAGLVEGTFSRAFKSEVRPVEIARKLGREMDENKVISLSRTYAPNEYAVWLSPSDHEQFSGYENDLRDELAAYLLEHARREGLSLLTRPSIEFRVDDRLRLGEFGIQARMVSPAEERDAAPRQGDHGHTSVYKTSDRMAQEAPPTAPPPPRSAARLRVGGRTEIISSSGAVVGRSQDCDVVLDDANVSRRHAEIRLEGGRWLVQDLNSTNGVKVNGRRVPGPHELASGDDLVMGSSRMTFELD